MNDAADRRLADRTEASVAPEELVGRDRELEGLSGTTKPGRWVEVIGAPGIGKSALVHAFVSARIDRGENWLVVDVRRHASVDDALGELANRAAVETGAMSAASQLARLIGSRLESRGVEGLLLDNADAFADHSGLLRLLHESAFGVTWLSTSRSELGPDIDPIVVRVDPLSRPAGATLYRRVASRFWVGPGSPGVSDEDVEALVDRVDGHPLAIRLAASRINSLPPDAFSRRLAHEAAPADGGDRQGHALRPILRDGWTELDGEARELLRFLAQFAGAVPFDVIQGAAGSTMAPTSQLLETLARSGWIEPTGGDSTSRRFELHDVIRSFARRSDDETSTDSASDRQGLSEATARHADVVTQRAEELEHRILRGTSWSTVEELEQLAPDLLLAFDRASETDPERAGRALLPLRWLVRLGNPKPSLRRRSAATVRQTFLNRCRPQTAALLQALAGVIRHRAGRPQEAADLCADAFRSLPDNAPPSIRSEVAVASSLCLGTIDPQTAARRAENARRAASETEAPIHAARAAERSGYLALDRFELRDARRQFIEARDLLDDAGDRLFSPSVLSGLGYVEHRLDLAESAQSSLDEAVAMYDESERESEAAHARFNRGVVLLARHGPEEAVEDLEVATGLLDRAGTPSQSAAARIRLGLATFELGEIERARTHLRDALSTAQDEGDRHNQALAEGTLAAFGEEGARAHQFDIPLQDLEFETSPAAAATFLAYSAVCFDLEGNPDRAVEQHRHLGRIQNSLSDEDRYLRRIVASLVERCGERLGVGDAEGTNPPKDQRIDNPWARIFERLLEELRRADSKATSRIIPAQGEETHRLRIHQYGHWFQVDDADPVDLTSRDPLRRILSAVLDVSEDSEREGASVDELIEVGWPDAQPTRSSGANRVYYSIRKLRELGLEEILITGESGYRFGPRTKLRISETPYEKLGS